MTPTVIAFLGYIILMVLLVIVMTSYRGLLTLSGKRAANSFSTTGEDVSEFSQRLCRAHANFYETFPLVGGVLLFALATNNTGITDPLALILITARLLQTLVHLSSTSVFAVFLRFGFFMIQISIVIIWLLNFLQLI